MKCLITKLNGIVKNDNILTLGALRVMFYKNNANSEKLQSFSISPGVDAITIKASNEVRLTTDTGLGGSNFVIPDNAGKIQITVPNEDVYIDIFPIYNIKGFIFGGSGETNELNNREIINPEIFKFCNKVEVFNFKEHSKTPLKMEYFQSTSLRELNISYTNVTGNLKDLKVKENINNFSAKNCTSIKGNLDDILDKVVKTGENILEITNTPNIIKKRSTITTLQSYGFTVKVTQDEVSEEL
nr:MAG TPA: hypothetical protein [Caudoviricetes sp.]